MIMNDGMMIFIIFGLIIMLPIIVTAAILCVIKHRRSRKKKIYSGVTKGRVDEIKIKGLDYPNIMYVTYFVDGAEYHIKETVKMKSEAIKIGGIPVGQRNSYQMGNISVGDSVTIQYDPSNPAKALIAENDGTVNV